MAGFDCLSCPYTWGLHKSDGEAYWELSDTLDLRNFYPRIFS